MEVVDYDGEPHDGEPELIAKFLVSSALLGVAVVGAGPANADPSLFNDLGCSCPQTISDRAALTDQLTQGIQSGLDDLRNLPATR